MDYKACLRKKRLYRGIRRDPPFLGRQYRDAINRGAVQGVFDKKCRKGKRTRSSSEQPRNANRNTRSSLLPRPAPPLSGDGPAAGESALIPLFCLVHFGIRARLKKKIHLERRIG